MAKKEQKILCDVDSCKYNDCDEQMCLLSVIKVCCCEDASCKSDTICDSFEEKKSKE